MVMIMKELSISLKYFEKCIGINDACMCMCGVVVVGGMFCLHAMFRRQ